MTGHALIPVTIAGAFTVGMILALLGSIKLSLAQRLGMDETRVGGLLSALNLALIPMMLVSGIFVDQIGLRGVLVTGSLLAALAVFALAMTRRYTAAFMAILFAGAGGACISTAAVKLMPAAFWEQSPAASLNLGNVFFGLGALITPTLAELLTRTVGFRRSLGLLAVLCLAPALAVALAPAQAFAGFASPQAGSLDDVLASPVLWLVALAFLLYSPIEGALGTWTTTYFRDLGFRERSAALLLSGFWLTFMAGRLLIGFLQQTILPGDSEGPVIVALALLSAVVLANLAGTHYRTSAAWGILLTGALLGPIFPTIVGILFKRFPVERGTAYGAMFAIGATGSAIVAPLIGAYARRRSVRAALRIPTIVALLLAGATMALALMMSSLL
jgi:FHS family glucose/mannose:H+ symporter-like MFS transporter